VPPDEARARLDALRAAASTRAKAAALCGVHRNTFRRQLRELADTLGDDAVAW